MVTVTVLIMVHHTWTSQPIENREKRERMNFCKFLFSRWSWGCLSERRVNWWRRFRKWRKPWRRKRPHAMIWSSTLMYIDLTTHSVICSLTRGTSSNPVLLLITGVQRRARKKTRLHRTDETGGTGQNAKVWNESTYSLPDGRGDGTGDVWRGSRWVCIRS